MRDSDILIVNDEVGIRDLLSEILQGGGYSVALAENAEEARQLRHQVRPAMVLLDIWMLDCDNITLLKEWAKDGQLSMPVMVMSGHTSIDTAIRATKIDALDFLEKLIILQKLLSAVDRALKHGKMQATSGLSLDKLDNSPVIQSLNHKLGATAKRSGPVFLSGKVGSPFESMTRHLRKNGISQVEPAKVEHVVDTPLELLQKTTGGVLYAGNIAQYSKNIQSGIVLLLGKANRYSVRIITANSRGNEETAVQDGRLLELLSKTIVALPPLCSQPDDIAFLINQIVAGLADTQKVQPVKFSSGALAMLCRYEWSGNFDRLRGVVRSLALGADGGEVEEQEVGTASDRTLQSFSSGIVGGFNFNMPLCELREELERRYLEYHAAQEGQNMSRVAQKVGLERTHLYRKPKQLGISIPHRSGDEGADE